MPMQVQWQHAELASAKGRRLRRLVRSLLQKRDQCAQMEEPELASFPTSSCIGGDFGHECAPSWTKTTAIQQDSWALFEPFIAAVTVADPAPAHMRDNMIKRDIILTHQFGCESRGAVDGAG